MLSSLKRKTLNLFAGYLLSILSHIAAAELLVIIPDYTEGYTSVAQAIIDSAFGYDGHVIRYSDLKKDIDCYDLVVSVGKDVVLNVNHDPRFKNTHIISAFAPRSSYQLTTHKTAIFSDVNPAYTLN
ncbi:MAG: hypothetical protein MI974_23280 [Chitinophagales bacterium]|nr:hypothetical protein [Chitinophagales bacterium]